MVFHVHMVEVVEGKLAIIAGIDEILPQVLFAATNPVQVATLLQVLKDQQRPRDVNRPLLAQDHPD